jgi:hypothetical protein
MSDELTNIRGIDAESAAALREQGLTTPEDVANASLSELTGVGNIEISTGPNNVTDVRQAAAEYATTKKVRQTPVEEIEESFRSFGISEFTGGTYDYKDKSQTESPFTVEASGLGPAAVDKIHESRTERAQDVDEQQNAPVTTDEEKWIENKNRYDYPGVDTIPEQRQARRAEQAALFAQDQGAVDRVEQKGSAKTLQGKFSPSGNKTYGRDEDVVRVQGNANQPERTLAHEVGHAIDFGFGEDRGYNLTDELFGLDTPTSEGETEQLTDEAIGLSEKARGDFEGQEQYRRQYTELTADVVGQAIIQPRATKRDAPNVFERLEDAAEQEGFGEIFPEPLGRDPEGAGILD